MPNKSSAAKYETTAIANVPHSRRGKHHDLMGGVVADLENLKMGQAMKVPLKGLNFSKEKIRSALNRATAKKKISVATASDSAYLYIWRTDGK